MAGVASGALNAMAGGGSLISFPTLTLCGLPDLNANATNTAAQWPGSLASTFGYREKLSTRRADLMKLLPVTLIGGTAGALLLLQTPESIFRKLIPVLIATATISLMIPKSKSDTGSEVSRWPAWVGFALQAVISLYGGYFGAGMGIMMLAGYRHWLSGTIHEHNAIKNALAVAINLSAAAIFLGNGAVVPVAALVLTLGSILGGYFCSKTIQGIAPEKIRMAIIAFGWLMTGIYAWRAFFA